MDEPAGPPPTRAQVAAHSRGTLGKRRWYRPVVHDVALPDGRRLVVKDFLPCPWFWRWTYGRFLTGREARAYRRLAGVEGIPRFAGRIDAFALAVEHVPGRDLGKCPRGSLRAEVFDRLDATVEAMHARGVLHLDLRQRRNVLVEDSRVPRVIDLSSGLVLDPRCAVGRFLLRVLGPVDRSGVLKYRRRFLPDSLTEEQRRALARHARWRRWWWWS